MTASATPVRDERTPLSINPDGAVTDTDGAVVGHVAAGTAVARASAPLALQRKATMLRPIATPAEILQVQEETRAFVAEALQEGRDFGRIPGVDKPSLFKPGAERVCAAFNVYPRYRIIEQEVDHVRELPWRKTKKVYEGPRGNRRVVGEEVTEGISLGLYRFVVECELVNRETEAVVGSAVGSCSTVESKYADRPRDVENTVLQMAQKRAHVAATRTTFGLSEQFTQDVEDNPEAFQRGAAEDPDAVACPKCRGAMWDNRVENDTREKNGQKRRPDYSCKDKNGCGTVIWDAAKYAEELAKNDAVGAQGDAGKADAPASSTHGASGTGAPSSNTNSSSASGSARTDAPARGAKPAREKLMPFGDHKGTPLGEIPLEDLIGIRDWAQKRDAARFGDLIAALQDVIEEKRTAVPAADGEHEWPGDEDPYADDLPF